MPASLIIEPVNGIPVIRPGDDIASILVETISNNNQVVNDQDIICIASKIVSKALDCFKDLSTVNVSPTAHRLHTKLPNKDPRILQLVLEQANNREDNLRINPPWIGAKNQVGRILTSAGIDKVDDDTVLLLPESPDDNARTIGEKFKSEYNTNNGIIITDSDGREGIAGSTQLCIGLYGIPPLRKYFDAEETICDMLAATAGLSMGQQRNNIPAVIIRGFDYTFNSNSRLKDAY